MMTILSWLIVAIIAAALIRLRERWILPLLAIAVVIAICVTAGVVR